MKAAISAGVDVNAADENGQTALFKIIKRSNYEFTEPLIEFLLSSKADANIKDKSGTTILEEATRSKKIMGLLRKYGAQDTAKTIGL